MEIHIARDGAYLGAETGDFIGQHARGRDLDRVIPVVVVVAQRVCEVKDRHLRDLGRVLSDIEMSGLDGALSDGVRHEEEIELAVNDLRLLNKASIDIGTLGRVVDEVLSVIAGRLLEESLADALVDNNQGDFGVLLGRILVIASILCLHDSIELGKLLVNDLLTHGITDTVTVDEDMARHGSIVELTVRLEGSLEVVGQDGRGDNLLALDRLRASLSIVLAHVGIVSSTETNR